MKKRKSILDILFEIIAVNYLPIVILLFLLNILFEFDEINSHTGYFESNWSEYLLYSVKTPLIPVLVVTLTLLIFSKRTWTKSEN